MRYMWSGGYELPTKTVRRSENMPCEYLSVRVLGPSISGTKFVWLWPI
jgi:hypothetical protein